MESKSAELKDNGVDLMHVHETLVSKGLAFEGLSNLLSQVAVLKREALLIDAGIAFLSSHSIYHLLCIVRLLAVVLSFMLSMSHTYTTFAGLA